jgi:demethylmenaquinone methyltransferase/2-methoxy-6-polyprenyl-1,4-benzoquinol methylase
MSKAGTSVTGTTPQGAANEREASRWVRGMFGHIAKRYDFLNHLLSFNLDRRWRARLVERVADILDRDRARVLDLCCGTADVMILLQKRRGRATILGSDFCHPMLLEARKKTQSPIFEADALALPVSDASLDLITIAFGFRNLANYRRGMEELLRVLKPGGVAAVLEFSQPTNRVWRMTYGLVSRRILPWIGGLISGSRQAYAYLPESIQKFPGADELAEQMRDAGFNQVEFDRMAGGAVALHLARK